MPITIGLKKTNPFIKEGCQYNDPECIAASDGDCWRMGIVYVIRCKSCHQDIDPEIKESLQKPGGVKSHHYLGMTACSLHNRMIDHRKGHRRKDSGNPLFIHDQECHNGERQEYYSVTAHREILLLNLMMKEAILIEGQQSGTSMNGKQEKGRGKLIRIQAVRNDTWAKCLNIIFNGVQFLIF